MIQFTVNGKKRSFSGAPFERLIDVLREDFRLTGVKEGCGEGECGACTVLVDGAPVCACLVPVAQADGARVTTVEGLAKDPAMRRLQRAFVECGAAQCGICTPGFLCAAAPLVRGRGRRRATRAEVAEALAGNLCRCTGYEKILRAVLDALRPRQRTRLARGRTR